MKFFTQKDIHFLNGVETYATMRHTGQTRRGGMPYIIHPLRVAQSVREAGYGVEYVAVALLHDVLEDTSATVAELRKIGCKSGMIGALRTLTLPPFTEASREKVYEAYLDKILRNNIAKVVKFYDILDNLGDNPSPRQLEKYTKALKKFRIK